MSEQTEIGERPRQKRAAAASEEPLSGVIRCLREQLGMTQEELARAVGIAVGTVSRWESGRCRPSRLARSLILDFARRRQVAVHLKPALRPDAAQAWRRDPVTA